jgi:hypothetical protein
MLAIFFSIFLLLCLLAHQALAWETSSSKPQPLFSSNSRAISNAVRAAFLTAAATTTAPRLLTAARANAAEQKKLSTSEFVAKWPFIKPQDILDFIYSETVPGDVSGVLRAMDQFASYYPMYKLTPVKASILSHAVSSVNPRQVLEIGTFFGYSAIHIAKTMQKECFLTCIEANEDNVFVTKAILKQCFGSGNNNGVLDRINILTGTSTSILRSTNVNEQIRGSGDGDAGENGAGG